MKTWSVLLIAIVLADVVAAVPITLPTGGQEIPTTRAGTLQAPWHYVRNEGTTGYVDANDAAIDVNDMVWQNTGGYFRIPAEWNSITLTFYAYGDGSGDGEPNGGTFDCNVYVAEPYSSWEQVMSFTATVGLLALTHHPAAAGDGSHNAGGAINSGSVDPNNSYRYAQGPFTDNLSDVDAWPVLVDYSGQTNGMGRASTDIIGGRVLIVRYANKTNITRIYGMVKGR